MARLTIRSGVLVVLLTNYASAERNFMGLGFLPGGSQSQALHISPNGRYVVGPDFLWTHGGGMQSIGIQGRDVSDTGVVVGSSNFVPSSWTSGGGTVALGSLPGNAAGGSATSVSADGSTIVGFSTWDSTAQAFRWTQTEGMIGLGIVPGGQESTAYAISDDASYIVGTSQIGAPQNPLYNHVFGYDGSLHDLGFPQSGSTRPRARVNDVLVLSGETRVIVGSVLHNAPEPTERAFARFSNGGELSLPAFPNSGDFGTAAYCIADSGIVLGIANQNFFPVGAMWVPGLGIRALADVLSVDYGIDMSGWGLIVPQDITPDGRYIVGYGYRVGSPATAEAFVAFIPEPATMTLFALLTFASRRRAACKR